jgi:quinoprotein glucose dehydrogenase
MAGDSRESDLMKLMSTAAILSTMTVVSSIVFAQAASVNDGVFTAAQADRGAAVFKTSCTACHDTSRFTGDEFLNGWTGKPLHALFDQMSTSMPEDNPGSLKPQQYADVVAYFLRLNGYPVGKTELASAADALKAIKFDKRGLR